MIEYYLHTGESPNPDNYYNVDSVAASRGYSTINNPLIGHFTINGISLLETIADVSVVAQTEIIDNTGDFFLSGFSLRDGTGFLDFSSLDSPTLKHDIVNSGEHSFFISNDHDSLIVGFSGEVGTNLTGDFVFLNGVKLISGTHYIEDSNGNFEWISSNTDITGKMFVMPNMGQFYSGGFYDCSGQGFNQGTSVGYLNGVKLDNKDFLETSSIVDSIQTGIEPFISFTGGNIDSVVF